MVKFSSIFNISQIPEDQREPINYAFRLIDSIHSVPERIHMASTHPIIIRTADLQSWGNDVLDSYQLGTNRLTVLIEIGLQSPHPLYDTVHELGHAFDHHILGDYYNIQKEITTSLELSELRRLYDSIKASSAYKSLKAIQDEQKKYDALLDTPYITLKEVADILQINHDKAAFLIVRYRAIQDALKPEELFARVYVQTIIEHSKDALLIKDLRKYGEMREYISKSFIWESNDFKPINTEMTALLAMFPVLETIE